MFIWDFDFVMSDSTKKFNTLHKTNKNSCKIGMKDETMNISIVFQKNDANKTGGTNYFRRIIHFTI